MIDWGVSAAIMAVVTFIVTQVNDHKIKKLNDRIAKIEREYSALYNEVVKVGDTNDTGSV